MEGQILQGKDSQKAERKGIDSTQRLQLGLRSYKSNTLLLFVLVGREVGAIARVARQPQQARSPALPGDCRARTDREILKFQSG